MANDNDRDNDHDKDGERQRWSREPAIPTVPQVPLYLEASGSWPRPLTEGGPAASAFDKTSADKPRAGRAGDGVR